MTKTKFILLFLIWGGFITIGILTLPRLIPYTYPHTDFYVYYLAGELISSKLSPYGITDQFRQLKANHQLDFHWSTGYVYPPLLAQLFSLIIFIPPRLLAWIWFGFNLFLYLLVSYRLYRLYPHRFTLPLIFSFSPAIYGLASGQTTFIVLYLFLLYLTSNSALTASFSLSFIGQLKVYPLLLGFLSLARHRYRLLLTLIATSLILTLIPIILSGPQTTFHYFFQVLPQLQADADPYFTHQSLNAFLARLRLASPLAIFLPPLLSLAFLLFLILYTLKSSKSWFLLHQIWFLGLSLITGRQTLWNYLPTLISMIYLLPRFSQLTPFQKFLYLFTLSLTNLVWHFLPAILTITSHPLIASLGFFAYLAFFILLVSINESTCSHQNYRTDISLQSPSDKAPLTTKS